MSNTTIIKRIDDLLQNYEEGKIISKKLGHIEFFEKPNVSQFYVNPKNIL